MWLQKNQSCCLSRSAYVDIWFAIGRYAIELIYVFVIRSYIVLYIIVV